jgi:hypothetical protein
MSKIGGRRQKTLWMIWLLWQVASPCQDGGIRFEGGLSWPQVLQTGRRFYEYAVYLSEDTIGYDLQG